MEHTLTTVTFIVITRSFLNSFVNLLIISLSLVGLLTLVNQDDDVTALQVLILLARSINPRVANNYKFSSQQTRYGFSSFR